MNMNSVNEVIAKLAAVTLPVPDLVLVAGSVVLMGLVYLVASRRPRNAMDGVSSVYMSELARANRNMQSAESKLTQVKSQLERERRRNRRAD